MRRYFALCVAALALLLASGSNAAEVPDDGRGFVFAPMVATGGGFTGSGTLLVGVRTRFLRYAPLGLEAGAIVGYPVIAGCGFSGLLYLVSVKSFRLHVNMGATVFAKPLTSPEVSRAYDLTIGTGVELDLPLWKLPLTATLDYRAFLPDPTKVPLYFGDFAAAIYREAFFGGAIWLGLAYRFSF
jgi:hypothetical protein